MNASIHAVLALFAIAAGAAPLAQDRGDRGGGPSVEAQRGGAPPERGDSQKKAPKDEDLGEVYFKVCDYDGDGWILFEEAQKSMNLDRAAFAAYDTDGDGRISPEEFARRYRAIVSRGGAFAPPAANLEAKKKPPRRTADELLDAYDDDRDKALNETEVGKALRDYGAHGVDAKVIVEKLDTNGTKKLEVEEIPALLDVLSPAAASGKKKAASIAELFDRVEPRNLKRESLPQPAHIVGPVTAFRRLDYDNSGGIDAADLALLQHPLQLPVRMNAVLASLDTDGDGVISAEEFWASMK